MASDVPSQGRAGGFIIRSCDKECFPATEGKITGTVPDWLEGSLIRNGPGVFEVGPDRYDHWFDGMAVLHRFHVARGGKVTYQNRMLNSNTYQTNMRAQRIVVTEFGTTGHPDPCMTIFQRFKAIFTSGEMTDNDCVNVLKIGDGLYAATESNLINRIDPETLETKEKVDLQSLLAVNTCTAHPHYAQDGALLNMGSAFSGKAAYCIVQFPAQGEESLTNASVLCRIPCNRPFYPSYYHSFGLTDNYVVFVEQPLVMSVGKILWRRLWGHSFADSLIWEKQQLVRFHIVRRTTGEILKTNLVADPFMVFHHGNAYETEDGKEVVVDLCTYEDDTIIKQLYFKEINKAKDGGQASSDLGDIESRTLRFVLPLEKPTPEQVESGANLVKLEGTQATATARKNGSILCKPENLTEDLAHFEMPQVNYAAFNGKKYKYLYGIGTIREGKKAGLMKVDVDKRSFSSWTSPDHSTSEPVFVAKPGATEEDDGVLLSVLLSEKDPKTCSLLILDAKNMEELGRADFQSPGVVPCDLHGMFLKS